MKTLLTVMAIALMMGPALVHAQTQPTAGAARGNQDDNTVYEKETTMTFEGDDVTGTLPRPGDENFYGEVRPATESLINIRSSFVPEMIKSVDSL